MDAGESGLTRIAGLQARQMKAHCRVPYRVKAYSGLAAWVSLQRWAFKKGRMKAARVAKLNAIGFDSNGAQAEAHCSIVEKPEAIQTTGTQPTTLSSAGANPAWDVGYEKLRIYRGRFGDCNVKTGWKEDPSHWNWVSIQRNRYKSGTLTQEQIRQLEELGFTWDWQALKGDQIWARWYRKLKDYKAEHGDCRISQNSKLGRWVKHQRDDFQKGKLKPDRIAALESIGFGWTPNAKRTDRLSELEAFRTVHGHCHVPTGNKSYSKLAAWLKLQRWAFRTGKMKAERIASLNALGVEWIRANALRTERRS